jgi:GTP cyclohydrolase IB
MTFPYFVMKKAPVSGVESLMDYQASLRRASATAGRACGSRSWCRHQPVPLLEEDLRLRRAQPALAHHHHGKLAEHMWLEELIDIAESEASCEVYGILKRPDEKYVTERAYDNPKFVEDLVRDVAVRSTPTSASAPMWSNRRISSRSTIIPPTR